MATRKPKLTRESLSVAISPPNNCQVAKFRETLDAESLEIFDEAVQYDKKDLPAPKLREWLLSVGFADDVVPTVDHITAHRQTARPCRCRS